MREHKTFANKVDKTVSKPSRATCTRWIDHKYQTMKNVLENWGVSMTHIESHSNRLPSKKGELQGFLRRKKQAKYVIHITIYLDVLTPIRHLSLGFQQNQHDPFKAVTTWTMVKLKLLIDHSLELNSSRLTFYKHLLADIEEKSIDSKTKYANQVQIYKVNCQIILSRND